MPALLLSDHNAGALGRIQLLQQHFRLLQIARIKAFREPAGPAGAPHGRTASVTIAHRSRRAPSIKPSRSLVRVLIAPPISRRTAEISRSGAKYPRIGAFPPGRVGLWIFALCLDGRYGRSVSAP